MYLSYLLLAVLEGGMIFKLFLFYNMETQLNCINFKCNQSQEL